MDFLPVLLVTFSFILSGTVHAQTPLVCTTPAERQDAVNLANSISNIVQSGVAIGGLFVQQPQQDQYNQILNNVISALQNGWSAPGACDAIANPIADPLAQIPFVGTQIQAAVKPAILAACELRKQQLGCP